MEQLPRAMGTAAFSPCGHYRWWLERQWARGRPRLLFIGLNPSRADGDRDDATLRRLVGYADRWGYGALEVINLFARISPTPALLRRAADPVGKETDGWILKRLAAHPRAPLWLGWGNRGGWCGRDRIVLGLLERRGVGNRAVFCLGHTGSGQPRHPLYLPANAPIQPWCWSPPAPLGHPEVTFAGPAACPPCREPRAAMRFTCT